MGKKKTDRDARGENVPIENGSPASKPPRKKPPRKRPDKLRARG